MSVIAVVAEKTARPSAATNAAPGKNGQRTLSSAKTGRIIAQAAGDRRSGQSADRRSARSRAALRSALIELIEEEGYDNITVADLCEAADLTRGTFYNHFKDKDALLASLEADVEDGLCGFRDRMASQNVGEIAWYAVRRKPVPLLIDLFAYLRSQGDFLHAVLGPGGDVGFGPRMRDSVCTGLIMSILHDKYREHPTTFVNYYVAFFASAYLGIISRWVETGMKESDEEMALIAQRLLFIKPGESIEL